MNVPIIIGKINRNEVKISKYSLESLILVSIIVTISFANSGILFARWLLYLVFFGSLIFLPILSKKLIISHAQILISAFIVILFNLFIIFFNYENYTSLYNGLLYSCTIMFFCILISTKYKPQLMDSFIKSMSGAGKFLFLLSLFFMLIQDIFLWVSGPSFLFMFLYFIYLDNNTKRVSKILYTFIWLINIYVFQERTFLLLFPIFLILTFFWDNISKDKIRYKLSFLIIMILLFLVPIIYILLSQSIYYQILNEYALKYTNSRFFSGRDIIWSGLINYYLENNLIFGGGHHVSPYFVDGYNISSHNTYITIITTTGILGALFFINLLLKIWNKYFLFKNVKAVRLSAIFFIITLLKLSSELSLIGNNIALSVLNWLVIAFGLIYINSKKDENEGKYV